MIDAIELRRVRKDSISPNTPVGFDTASPYSDDSGITYDSITGDIVFTKAGRYSAVWWVATETVLAGCIRFALSTTQDDLIESYSPLKKGQVSGFGIIDVQTPGVRLSLVNIGLHQVALSPTTPETARLQCMRIPDETLRPTFGVDTVTTVPPGSPAAVSVTEDEAAPGNWLFSFDIPQGPVGAAGISPHIDPDSGHWHVGTADTGVPAQGPAGTPEIFNFHITSANNSNNPVNYTVGNIRFAFHYYNSTTYSLRFFPAIPGSNLPFDYRRFTYYDATAQGMSMDGFTLTDTGVVADDTIFCRSNEWQSVFLRQKNAGGTWSLCECKLFASGSMARITLWIEWIYKDLLVEGW